MNLGPRTGTGNTARKIDPAFSESRAGNAGNGPYEAVHGGTQYTRSSIGRKAPPHHNRQPCLGFTDDFVSGARGQLAGSVRLGSLAPVDQAFDEGLGFGIGRHDGAWRVALLVDCHTPNFSDVDVRSQTEPAATAIPHRPQPACGFSSSDAKPTRK